MRAGKLRHRITIQQPAMVRQANGEATPTWTDFTTAWAKIDPKALWKRSGETIQSEAVQAQTSAIVTLRYQPGIDASMRVVWGVHVYDILSVLDVDGLHRELQLLCVEREAAAP